MSTATYSPLVQALLGDERLFDLGPGQSDPAASSRLRGAKPEDLFAPATIRDRVAAQACVAGLWLYLDHLDESHTISQDLATPEGSYWHGIMHRREPDYWNSKYWFRRVGQHAIFAPLRERAVTLIEEAGRPRGSEVLLQQEAWDPYAFVDLCEAVAAGRADCELLCRQVQRAEWDLLFDHCYRTALGS